MDTKIRQAFLILSDKSTDELVNFYETIRTSTSSLGKCFLLSHQKGNATQTRLDHINAFTFTDHIITQSDYFPLGFSLVPGNNQFPLIRFFLQHPDYDYYWCIEDDVTYSGIWKDFFILFSDIEGDFISSHVHSSMHDPNWYWWKALAHPYQVIPFEKRIRSFNPIYRISKQAIAFIHDALQSGWCGHHEVLFATLLYHAGFDIIDFGGAGEFVLPGFENQHYIDNSVGTQDGTMRWRPVFDKIGTEKNKLYHPVKMH